MLNALMLFLFAHQTWPPNLAGLGMDMNHFFHQRQSRAYAGGRVGFVSCSVFPARRSVQKQSCQALLSVTRRAPRLLSALSTYTVPAAAAFRFFYSVICFTSTLNPPRSQFRALGTALPSTARALSQSLMIFLTLNVFLRKNRQNKNLGRLLIQGSKEHLKSYTDQAKAHAPEGVFRCTRTVFTKNLLPAGLLRKAAPSSHLQHGQWAIVVPCSRRRIACHWQGYQRPISVGMGHGGTCSLVRLNAFV